jgi:hypothetical protein
MGARLLFPAFVGPGNWFIQSHPAILVSAWIGGIGPGLLATCSVDWGSRILSRAS